MIEMTNEPKLRFPEFVDGWDNKLLGDIATFSKGKGISKSDTTVNGEYECIRYGELYTNYNESILQVISRTNLDKKVLVNTMMLLYLLQGKLN